MVSSFGNRNVAPMANTSPAYAASASSHRTAPLRLLAAPKLEEFVAVTDSACDGDLYFIGRQGTKRIVWFPMVRNF